MAEIKRQKINVDLESLFPGDTITIGDQVLIIRPLGLKQLSTIAKKLKGFGEVMAGQGVTWDNYNSPENLLKLATTILDQFPDVLEEGSNIDVEDLQNLPIDTIVEILDKVIEVNMKSKEKLEGNFKSLAGRFGMVKGEKDKSPKQSKNS